MGGRFLCWLFGSPFNSDNCVASVKLTSHWILCYARYLTPILPGKCWTQTLSYGKANCKHLLLLPSALFFKSLWRSSKKNSETLNTTCMLFSCIHLYSRDFTNMDEFLSTLISELNEKTQEVSKNIWSNRNNWLWPNLTTLLSCYIWSGVWESYFDF